MLPDLIAPLLDSLQGSLVSAQEGPEPNDVVAGWTGFAVFIGLILAVAFLGWSLTKQLRKADRAAEKGLYDPSAKDERKRKAAATNGDSGSGSYGDPDSSSGSDSGGGSGDCGGGGGGGGGGD